MMSILLKGFISLHKYTKIEVKMCILTLYCIITAFKKVEIYAQNR